MKRSPTKTVLITGSTRGLGFAVAKLLDGRGYQLILTGRTKDSLELAREQLSSTINHITFCGDLTHEATREMLYEIPMRPQIIIHALGGKIPGDEFPLQLDILIRSVQFNLGVAAALNAHYLPLMQKENSGRIIHIGSDASDTGRSAPGYAAAKAAINAYVKSTARFYAKDKVMFCAVLPGIFTYPGDNDWDTKRMLEPTYYKKRLSEQPLGRFLAVDEIAEAIAVIADSDSLAYSGSLIKLTGAS